MPLSACTRCSPGIKKYNKPLRAATNDVKRVFCPHCVFPPDISPSAPTVKNKDRLHGTQPSLDSSKQAPWIIYVTCYLRKRRMLSLEGAHLKLFHSLKFYLFLEHIFKNSHVNRKLWIIQWDDHSTKFEGSTLSGLQTNKVMQVLWHISLTVNSVHVTEGMLQCCMLSNVLTARKLLTI